MRTEDANRENETHNESDDGRKLPLQRNDDFRFRMEVYHSRTGAAAAALLLKFHEWTDTALGDGHLVRSYDYSEMVLQSLQSSCCSTCLATRSVLEQARHRFGNCLCLFHIHRERQFTPPVEPLVMESLPFFLLELIICQKFNSSFLT